jgi:hypothetical protein
MRSFKSWVLVVAVFFGMSLASGTIAMAEDTTAAGTAPAAQADKADKTVKKHHKKGVSTKKHHKKKAEAETSPAPAADTTVKS